MATQKPQQQAIFADWLRGAKFVDSDGKLTVDAQLFFQNMTQALQLNFGPEGIKIPEQPASNIALLTAIQSLQNILYDSTNNVFVGNILNPASNGGTQYWLPFAMMIKNAGNPNGAQPGFVSQLCLDTVGLILYVCTTAGNAAGAVWTPT